MARLPGINYGAAVPSLGRGDVRGPLRVAAAQSAAAASIGRAAGVIGDAYKGIKEEEGRSALVEASSEWKRGEAEIRTNPNIDERNEQAEALRKDIEARFTDGMHSISAKAFKDKWDSWSQSKLDGVVTDGIQEQYITQRQKTETNALTMARNGELTESVGFVKESSVLNETEKAGIIKAAKLEFALGDLDRTSNSENPDMIAELLGEISDPDYSGPFKDDVRNAAINQLEGAFKTATAKRKESVAHEREEFASDLELGVRRGVLGPVDIMAAFEEMDENGDRIITGPKRTQLMAIYEGAQEDLQDDYAKSEMVKNYMAAGESMDRENKDHIDAVDFAYDDFVRRNPDKHQLVAEYGIDLARVTNILPKTLERDVQRLAYRGAPKAVEMMANVYMNLEEKAPQTLHQIGTQEKAIYKSTLSFFRGGVDLDRSVEMARENAFKNPEEKNVLTQRYSIEFRPSMSDGMASFQGWLDNQNDLFDVSFAGMGGAPKATNSNYTAYRSLELAYWINTDGDQALSEQFAQEDYRRIFSTSKMASKSPIMPYAPEREYGVPIGHEPMKKDLQEYFRKEGISDKNPYIYSDPDTARSPLGGRTYAVGFKDEFGNDAHHMGRWKYNVEQAAVDKKAVDQAEHDRQKKIDKEWNEGGDNTASRSAASMGRQVVEPISKIPGQVFDPLKKGFTKK
jgi:hypothetical protein